jgi:hypothetical protein
MAHAGRLAAYADDPTAMAAAVKDALLPPVTLGNAN